MWVDRTTLPFGSFILMVLVAGCLFTTGEPLTKEWPVAPESDMAYFTALHTFGILPLYTLSIGNGSGHWQLFQVVILHVGVPCS